MNEKLHDDEMDEARDSVEEVVVRSGPYYPKRARSPLVLMAIMLVFALAAIAGIVIAVTRDHQDPKAIVLPVHTKKSLDQAQPHSATEAIMPTASNGIDEEFAKDMILDREELPVSKIEELEQQETPIQLGPKQDSTPMTPVPEFSPQSLKLHTPAHENIQNDHQNFAYSTAPHWDMHTNMQGQKKTLESSAPISAAEITTQKPLVVIVIDDMGLNQRNSKRVVALDAQITLAYLPYAERLPEQTKSAFASGHELIVHMPMEPDNVARNNPGPNALLTTIPAAENIDRLNKNLSAFTQYMGLNNHMGSKMTADKEQMRAIMAKIKEKGLWFLDSKTIGHSIAAQIAAEQGVPYAVRDVFLDNVHDVDYVLGQLRETEKLANSKGYAIAIGHPHDATIAALQQWLPAAQSRGVSIVPLSTIIAKRFPHVDLPRYARTKVENKKLSQAQNPQQYH